MRFFPVRSPAPNPWVARGIVALLLLALAFGVPAQDNDLPVAAGAPEPYAKALAAGKDALKRKEYADAARAFGEALRLIPGDAVAEKGFGRAIRELEIYNTRYGDLKQEALRRFGMESAAPAIERGLKWLSAQQQVDGRWRCRGNHPDAIDDQATTAFALLALLADGNSETTGPHRVGVAQGIDFLLRAQRPEGSFGGARLYTEGMCTLALVEAFVMGGTEKHYRAAQNGITYIVKCQRPEGGWMYSGADGGFGDTSVTGMMFQPLKQGQMAYLDFDEKCLERGRRFVDLLTDPEHWVGYRQGQNPRHIVLTAIGELVRIYSGVPADDPEVKAGLDLVLRNKDAMRTNLYFLYYGDMLAFLAGGEAWTSWREVMLPFLLEGQQKEGPQAGAWLPTGSGPDSGYADYLSDVDATAMALLSLEVCYRYVPKKMMK